MPRARQRFVSGIFMTRRVGMLAAFGVGIAGCGLRESVPAFDARDARFGRLAGSGDAPSRATICKGWTSVIARDEWATTHVSFPETNVQAACFTPVRHAGRDVHVGPAPRGCGYPDAPTRARLEALAVELEAFADARPAFSKLFPCTLTSAEWSAASHHNARVLRALAKRSEAFPYAAVILPGHGLRAQNDTSLTDFLPGGACRSLGAGDLERLGGMPFRSARAADALRGDVAPVIIASGGAVHSRLNEAFAMLHLLHCRENIPEDRVLVEPCAEHTHTNLRNSGRWLHAMGGRVGYLVTDDFLQSDYFQDTNGFELLLGSIDQRSLRDWGYLLGSWRQASSGMKAGFWFTPYRFWAEPRDELGSATCVDE